MIRQLIASVLHLHSRFGLGAVPASVAAVAVLGVAMCVLAAKPSAQAANDARPTAKDTSRKAGVDYYGDPLPPGVLARMGSVRRRHEGAHIAFSPDGKTLISAGWDATVAFWDASTGRLLRRPRLRLPKASRLSVEGLSADGKVVAVFGREWVFLHDTTTGKELRRLPAGGIGHQQAAFSRDGKLLATMIGAGGRYVLRVWDLTTGRERFALPERFYIATFLFSPDGKLLATRDGSSGEEALRLWDTTTGRERGHVRAGDWRMSFSPDGKTLASEDRSGTVELWETATLKKQATLKPSVASWTASGLAYSPDGTLLAEAGDKGVVLWDVAARKERHRLDERGVRFLAFAPDGKTLACAGEFEVRLWDATTGKRFDHRPSHGNGVWSVAVSPDGKVVASTSWNDPLVRLWDTATGKPLPVTLRHRDSVRSCAFSADGKRLLTGSVTGTLRLWKTTGAAVRRLVIEDVTGDRARHEVLVCHLSRDGKRLAAVSAAYDKTRNRDRIQMSVWDARTGAVLVRRPFRGHLSSCFTPNGEGVTVDGRDHMSIEETLTGQERAAIPGDLGRPVAFAPDGGLAAVGIHRTRTAEGGYQIQGLRVAEVATGEEIFRFDGWIDFVAFSPEGRVLATADQEALRVWDVASGKLLFRRTWPAGLVRRPLLTPIGSLAFVPGGRAVVTGMGDGTLLLWDLAPATWPATESRRPRGKELDALWADLASDAPRAHCALHALAAVPVQAVPFLKDHLKPVGAVDPKRVEKCVGDLDSRSFAVRHAAFQELTRMGEQVGPALRRVLEGKPAIEMRKRVESLLSALRAVPPAAVLRVLRAIRTLERIDTPETRRILRDLAAGVPAARETREARAALERLTR